jgi:probable extracellular repeat, HAF family
MVDLGTFGGGFSAAFAVNGSGQVVGEGSTAAGVTHAFSWTQAGGMVDLGTLGGSVSFAHAVSDSGQVVGSSTSRSSRTRAASASLPRVASDSERAPALGARPFEGSKCRPAAGGACSNYRSADRYGAYEPDSLDRYVHRPYNVA